MDLLLDTSAFLAWVRGDSRLPVRWINSVVDPANAVFVSAATAWEVAIKRRLGKLAFAGSPTDAVEFHGFTWIDITAGDAEDAGSLEWAHRDPFDRMLVAQAARRALTLVTTDAAIATAPGIRLL
jgi:PIN domain nuclease of toxin-antitoxin system